MAGEKPGFCGTRGECTDRGEWKLCDPHGNAAAAVTAGAVAQIMQWALVRQNDPVMSNAAIKNMLIRGAKRSEDRGYPNREWGTVRWMSIRRLSI